MGINTIKINEIEYVRKDSVTLVADKKDGLKYVIIRADRAGVFAGYLESITDTVAGRVAIMRECRRLWYWSGAASLSQLALEGTKRPNDCKFPAELPEIRLKDVIEIRLYGLFSSEISQILFRSIDELGLF
jgi:hypothetical protein